MQTNDNQNDKRIDELEVRIAFLEDTIESLNAQMAEMSQQFDLAKQAMQMINRKVEQIGSDGSGIRDFSEETPPPHY